MLDSRAEFRSATGENFVDPKRSAMMSRIRGKNTKPEMIVRRLLHAAGHRYRLHARDLPGRPDAVFRKRRKVIFVHGCFWHRHSGCKRTTTPKTRTEFWSEKFTRNESRDRENENALLRMGWEVLVVWECETKNRELLRQRLETFLQSSDCSH